jgi:hypothetical protein
VRGYARSYIKSILRSSHCRDVILAEAFGADAKVDFISKRLEKHDKFFDSIKRLNLKTLSELAKKTAIKSSQNKIANLSDSKTSHCHPLSLASYHLEEVEHPPHL